MPHRTRYGLWLCLTLVWLSMATIVVAESTTTSTTVARCGAGWLEIVDGYRVLHLKGTPYEIGYQHGALLKEDVRENMHYLLEVKGTTPVKIGPISLSPRVAIESIVKFQERHVPAKYFQEMQGLAAAQRSDVQRCPGRQFHPGAVSL